MLHKKKGTIEWLEFELLANKPGLSHGVFLRHGGVSEPPFASLNVMRSGSDEKANVEKNRSSIKEILQLERLMGSRQVHGTKVEQIEDQENEPECDGLMTSRKNWGLLCVHADCQAAIFYDPIHKAIANIHAGWRGQVQNIYREAISKMGQNFGTRPEDLLVCISPSLGPESAEFKNYRSEFPAYFWEFQLKPTYFDLWAIADHQLQACGVLPKHIEIAKIDTYTNPSDFYSYRRETKSGESTGRHGTVVALLD